MKIILMIAAMFIFAWGGLATYWHIRESGFRDGYERGMKHFVAYHNCFPSTSPDALPSKDWRSRAWHYVNEDPQDCAFVISVNNDALRKSAQ